MGRLVQRDQYGNLYCALHESRTGPVLLITHPDMLTDHCPFCWFEERPDHACEDPRCYCRLVREAVARGDVWTKPPRRGS